MPDSTELTTAVQEYLSSTGNNDDAQTVAAALTAERAAQANVCKVDPDTPLPADLLEALCRRVARNLAMRRLPLGVMSDDLGSTRLGSNDPEVRRLERPYRRLVFG